MSTEPTDEEIKAFIRTLPVASFQYRNILNSYSEYVSHDIYNPQEPMKLNKKYFSKKPKKAQMTPGTWTEEELDVLFNAVKKFGQQWKTIYREYSIFSKNGKKVSDLTKKFKNVSNLPRWKELDT